MPEQATAAPVMREGCAGVPFALIASVLDMPVPQKFAPVTLTLPLVPLGTTVMLLVVLVPVQPVGSDQL